MRQSVKCACGRNNRLNDRIVWHEKSIVGNQSSCTSFVALVGCGDRQATLISTPPAAATSTTIQGVVFHAISRTKQVSASAN